jgi:hypothetical protein
MSSTVRHLAADSKPHVFLPSSSISLAVPRDDVQRSEHKRFFDMRRSMIVSDDCRRLHLDDIKTMVTPDKSSSGMKGGLIPEVADSNIARSS